MVRLLGRVSLLACGLLLTGCGSGGDAGTVCCLSTPTTQPPAAAVEACTQPLSAYCGDRPCPTFPQALAAIQRAVRGGWCQGLPRGYYRAATGRCNDLDWVNQSGPFGGEALFFAADGTLVAARVSSDAGRLVCGVPAFGTVYGLQPVCSSRVTTDLCAEG